MLPPCHFPANMLKFLVYVLKGKMIMSTLKLVVTVIYCILCVALAGIVLLQEGKQQGLGTIAGAADTYWGKNKSRSLEGNLNKATTVVALGFIVLSFVLNLDF